MAELLTVVAEMLAKPGKEEELQSAALALVEPTRKEEGCVQYDLHVHTDEPGRIVFYENWKSRDDLTRHLATPYLVEFLGRGDELLAAPARVETYRRIA
jgi:quinol monooxygenase YgiN